MHSGVLYIFHIVWNYSGSKNPVKHIICMHAVLQVLGLFIIENPGYDNELDKHCVTPMFSAIVKSAQYICMILKFKGPTSL